MKTYQLYKPLLSRYIFELYLSYVSRMQVVCHGDVTGKSKQVICHKVSHKAVIIMWIVWFIYVLLCSQVGYENMSLNEQYLRDLNIKA